MKLLNNLIGSCKVAPLLSFFYLFLTFGNLIAAFLAMVAFLNRVALEAIQQNFTPILTKKKINDIKGAFGVMSKSRTVLAYASVEFILQIVSLLSIIYYAIQTFNDVIFILILMNLGGLVYAVTLSCMNFDLMKKWAFGFWKRRKQT